LKSYFLEIKDKKRRYKKLKVEEEEKDKLKDEILVDLENIYDLIKSASNYYTNKFNINTIKIVQSKELITQFQFLFKDLNLLSKLEKIGAEYLDKQKDLKLLKKEIEKKLNKFKKGDTLEIRLDTYLKKAKTTAEYQKIKEEYQNKKFQIKYILKASDKTKNTLTKLTPNKNYYQSFFNLYRGFSSLTAVEQEKNYFAEELKSLNVEKENSEKTITTLKNDIKTLSSSTKIENAQKNINQAQNNLEKKAQRYAVNKSVNFILKKLRERMVEKAEKELLTPASDILAKITSNHYTDLKTTADLDQSDFKIITENCKEFNSVQQLSRGSLEQLFLAVRLSRIREISPPLPLVLDDSLVNFDRIHLYNTTELISKLASRHQIFILSCHPHLISYISEITDSAQYWKLEEGEFELSNQQKLIDHLSH
jgi:uncharacterized protein YhaN